MSLQEAYELAAPTLEDQPGSPTRAEVMALFDIYRGQAISELVIEAILLSTNNGNRQEVEDYIKDWNETANGDIPLDKKISIGRSLGVDNLTTVLSERGSGLIDTSELLKLNLRTALYNEITQHVEELV